jgi:hypothetical protein
MSSPTLLGSATGVTFGMAAETGILVTSFSAAVKSDKLEVRDENGSVKLISYYNPVETITVAGTVAGTSGVAAAQIGVALTLANTDSLTGGITTGINIVDSVTVSKKQNGFKDISISASRYPLITS